MGEEIDQLSGLMKGIIMEDYQSGKGLQDIAKDTKVPIEIVRMLVDLYGEHKESNPPEKNNNI